MEQAKLIDMLETYQQALENKDKELAEGQKMAREKTKAAEDKLASVEKLEEENKSLKVAVAEVKKDVARQSS